MRKAQHPNVISFSGFATLKGVARTNVQHWVEQGRIKPTIVGDKKMIDLDQYADFKPGDIPKGPPVELESLGRRVKNLEKRVDTLLEQLQSK